MELRENPWVMRSYGVAAVLCALLAAGSGMLLLWFGAAVYFEGVGEFEGVPLAILSLSVLLVIGWFLQVVVAFNVVVRRRWPSGWTRFWMFPISAASGFITYWTTALGGMGNVRWVVLIGGAGLFAAALTFVGTVFLPQLPWGQSR